MKTGWVLKVDVLFRENSLALAVLAANERRKWLQGLSSMGGCSKTALLAGKMERQIPYV